MKIISNNIPIDNLLDWTQVNVLDDNGKPMSGVRKLTLTVVAGDVAKLEVEIYNTNDCHKAKNYVYGIDRIEIEAPERKRILKVNSRKNKNLKLKKLKDDV